MTDFLKEYEQQFQELGLQLRQNGYVIADQLLPSNLLAGLCSELREKHQSRALRSAKIGRQKDTVQREDICGDRIQWIDDTGAAQSEWLAWASALQLFLNRQLYLGLYSFESHFAHYAPGAAYQRHLDAFQGEANRVLSLVLYLNEEWHEDYGGELWLYPSVLEGTDIVDTASTEPLVRIIPQYGRVVLFMSEEFPHEVRPATQDRFSIAGWFRLNNSAANRIDA